MVMRDVDRWVVTPGAYGMIPMIIGFLAHVTP